ncbi:kinase [Lottiidibacillus patelloidae]|uniref:Kinase n=1 Tax=Lottiidibacillus patelloidae TaxID=2670334 RepID=A0A263BXA8_9BACI|nr:AarF/UbiB family protein [Lottiidibacillus patelloidae]OZM58344.1 kinase [Lottiidibacillus patelloidae]
MDNFFKAKKKISHFDLKNYKQIAQGKDGRIYSLTSDKCVKFFFREDTCKKEYEALKLGQKTEVIPRVYESGDNYIVMEFVKGVSLAHHMKKNGYIDKELTRKILFVLNELKRVGFKRLDTEIRHLLLNKQGQFKVIDHKRAFSTKTSVPIKLIKGLKKYGLEDQFLSHVQRMQPLLYNNWKDKL